MLRKGNSLKLIATAVGYTNATALTRVFTQRLETSPTEWLRAQRALLHPKKSIYIAMNKLPGFISFCG